MHAAGAAAAGGVHRHLSEMGEVLSEHVQEHGTKLKDLYKHTFSTEHLKDAMATLHELHHHVFYGDATGMSGGDVNSMHMNVNGAYDIDTGIDTAENPAHWSHQGGVTHNMQDQQGLAESYHRGKHGGNGLVNIFGSKSHDVIAKTSVDDSSYVGGGTQT